MSKSKQKGTAFERQVVDYLNANAGGGYERRALEGKNDRGDVSGAVWRGMRVVLECKAVSTLRIPDWLREAAREAENDKAAFGAVVWKRRGVGEKNAGEHVVMMRLEDFAKILGEPRSEG